MTIENVTAIVLAYVLVSMGVDHRVPVGRVRDRMVHWSAAPAPRTERRRVNRVRGVRRGFFFPARAWRERSGGPTGVFFYDRCNWTATHM